MELSKKLTLKNVLDILAGAPNILMDRKTDLATIWNQTRDAIDSYNAKQCCRVDGIRTLCMSRDLLIRLLGVVFPDTPLTPPMIANTVKCWLFDFEIRVSETEVGAEFAAYLCAGIDDRKCLAFTNDGASELVSFRP